ncbi:hypothetical protein [Bacillus atrophaeus]|uniref:hypothetical protein n=1 Tax=Bacillus atrophaeus TaxID=1452 RepID=UPI00077A9936|nr:hypothetical protein [Bacillus atrophaeus]KXZ13258.1 hypothetical protein AXI57_16010 [Bacillus atrophaeus]MED4806335.1 hypothetical protein [Bacillus atrophaeus]UFD97638.1 hypothetical protein [Bacillus atrophaeus]GED04212.1 hypothetical protein BAT02nite_38560 [Bacillus atrophaeus]
MSKTILPLKKELPIEYLYSAVCLNDIYERLFGFKKDVIYEFFRKGDGDDFDNQYYVKAYGTDIYQEIDFRLVCFAYTTKKRDPEDELDLYQKSFSNDNERSRSYFKVLGHTEDSIEITKYKKFLGLFKYIEYNYFRPRVKKGSVSSDEYSLLNRDIKAKVCAPIELLKKQNKDIILEFSESICYALATLENFCKIPDVVDLKDEIDKVNELLKGYYSFALSANESFKDKNTKEMKEFLEKHHSLMNSLNENIKNLTDGRTMK